MNGFWMLSAIWWMQISFVFTSPVYIFQHGNMLSTSTIRWKIEVLRVSNWDKQFGLNIRKLAETHRSLVRSWLLILGMTLKAHFDSLYWEYSSCLQMHWEETLDPVVRGRFCRGYESETGKHLCKWLEWKKKKKTLPGCFAYQKATSLFQSTEISGFFLLSLQAKNFSIFLKLL